MLDCEGGGKVLFGLGQEAFHRCARHSNFWVTAQRRRIGCRVRSECALCLDVGRSRLAAIHSQNGAFRAVGRKVGALLESLFDASWIGIASERLTLTQDATRDGFWNSLWQIMVSSSTSVANVQSLPWHSESNYLGIEIVASAGLSRAGRSCRLVCRADMIA